MSYAHERLDGFTIDWLTATLVGLVLAFNGAVLGLLSWDSPQPATQSTDATIGLRVILIAAIEIGAILLLWRGYKRLPDKWQWYVKLSLLIVVGAVIYYASLTILYLVNPVYAVAYIVAMPALHYTRQKVTLNGYTWILFNVVALSLGVTIVRFTAQGIAPHIAIILMLAFLVYDHYAVKLSSIMSDLIELSGSVSIPNFVVIPTTLHFELESVTDFLSGESDEKPENMALMIGVGDFVFPSLLIGSVYVASESHVPVLTTLLGTIVATIVLRDSLERSSEGLPALPWLNTGAIGGYIIGLVLLL